MALRLHAFPPSPAASRRSLWRTTWSGLRVRFLRLAKGDQKSAAYTALNPNAAHADARGRRLQAMGIERHHPVPRDAKKWESGLCRATRTVAAPTSRAGSSGNRDVGSGLRILIFERRSSASSARRPIREVEKGLQRFNRAASSRCSSARRQYVSGDHLTIADFAIVQPDDGQPAQLPSKAIARSPLGWKLATSGWQRTRPCKPDSGPGPEFGGNT